MNKVSIISPSFANMNCGLADYVSNLVKLLNFRNFDVSVITSDTPKIKEYAALDKEKRFRIFPVIRRWDLRALFNINKILGKINPEVIHIMYHWYVYNQGIFKGAMVTFMPLFLKLGQKNRRKVVISFVHDIMGPYLFPKAGPLRKLALFIMLFFSDKITVHSQRYKIDLGRFLPFLNKKIDVIPCGSGVVYELPIKTRENNGNLMQKQKETVLSFFGYIYPAKGLEYLIEAMKLLTDRGYRPMLLLIGGFSLDYKAKEFDSYPQKIKNLISSYSLDSSVQWLGFCESEEVSLNLLRSDICVLPFNDGVNERGSSFNTALSHGLPLVTTLGPYAPKKLIHGENVLLVPARNSKLLAEAIQKLIDNKGLREKLSRGAKRVYEEEYSWPIIADRTARLYGEALN